MVKCIARTPPVFNDGGKRKTVDEGSDTDMDVTILDDVAKKSKTHMQIPAAEKTDDSDVKAALAVAVNRVYEDSNRKYNTLLGVHANMGRQFSEMKDMCDEMQEKMQQMQVEDY